MDKLLEKVTKIKWTWEMYVFAGIIISQMSSDVAYQLAGWITRNHQTIPSMPPLVYFMSMWTVLRDAFGGFVMFVLTVLIILKWRKHGIFN